jgi:hypothetical protein
MDDPSCVPEEYGPCFPVARSLGPSLLGLYGKQRSLDYLDVPVHTAIRYFVGRLRRGADVRTWRATLYVLALIIDHHPYLDACGRGSNI